MAPDLPANAVGLIIVFRDIVVEDALQSIPDGFVVRQSQDAEGIGFPRIEGLCSVPPRFNRKTRHVVQPYYDYLPQYQP